MRRCLARSIWVSGSYLVWMLLQKRFNSEFIIIIIIIMLPIKP
jgi:hypothetical protein